MKLYNSHTLRQIEADHAHCSPSLMARAGAAVARCIAFAPLP